MLPHFGRLLNVLFDQLVQNCDCVTDMDKKIDVVGGPGFPTFGKTFRRHATAPDEMISGLR